MSAPVEIDLGMEKLEMEMTFAEYDPELFKLFGLTNGSEFGFTVRGGLESGTEVVPVVVNARGYFKETEEGGAAGTVYANWYDKEKGEYHLEKIGNGDPETELQEIFATKEQAIAAAQAKFKRTKKSNQTFRFSTAGRTDLFAEDPLVLQRALRAAGIAVDEDGIFGEKTLAAVTFADQNVLMGTVKSEAAGYYRSIVSKDPSQKKFLKGWLNRAYRNVALN